MGLAGLVNAAMLVIAAALFFGTDIPGTDTLEGVHAGLARVLDQPAAFAFALALLASGFASSGVGTYAGQVVMQGFIRRSIPLLLRRALTLAPALVVLGIGIDPTRALVLSQVVLSFGIPFALVPLVLLTRRRDIMAELANHRLTTAVAGLAAADDHRAERLPDLADGDGGLSLGPDPICLQRRPVPRASAVSTSVASSVGKSMPVTAQARGNIEIGVKPGMVLTSLTVRSPSGPRKKSTRARPWPSSARNAATAMSRRRSATASSSLAGMSNSHTSSRYLESKS